MTAPTLPVEGVDLERRAIAAAEALRAYRVTLEDVADRDVGASERDIAHLDQRQEEVRAECSVLAATIRDAGEHGAEQVERMASMVADDTASLLDLEAFEWICRSIAHAAAEAGERTTEPGQEVGHG